MQNPTLTSPNELKLLSSRKVGEKPTFVVSKEAKYLQEADKEVKTFKVRDSQGFIHTIPYSRFIAIKVGSAINIIEYIETYEDERGVRSMAYITDVIPINPEVNKNVKDIF